MTTIAFKDGIIACDSQTSLGNMINGLYKKLIISDGKAIALAGSAVDCDIIAQYFSQQEEPTRFAKFFKRKPKCDKMYQGCFGTVNKYLV